MMLEDAWLYLDNNATTPCDPQVVEKMLPYFSMVFGNPANGMHRQGRKAGQAVDIAREQVAALVGVKPAEMFFTAGATESNNLAILGLVQAEDCKDRRRVVVSSVEHKSVLALGEYLNKLGMEMIQLPVDISGKVILDAAYALIDSTTLIVSVQAANNEVGVLQPVKELAEIAHENGAIFHCDGAQAVGKIPVDIYDLDVDMLSISAHKLYGPKGIGALYVRGGRRQVKLNPLVYGGGQENGLRPGTLNVPGMVGFGEACEIAGRNINEEPKMIAGLRDRLEAELSERLPDIKINGKNTPRLPNTSSITFLKIDADALILNLETIMIGTGSACSSGAIEPSHVLTAIGLKRENAFSTVRISLGRFTTQASIDRAVQEISRACSLLDQNAPRY